MSVPGDGLEVGFTREMEHQKDKGALQLTGPLWGGGRKAAGV